MLTDLEDGSSAASGSSDAVGVGRHTEKATDGVTTRSIHREEDALEGHVRGSRAPASVARCARTLSWFRGLWMAVWLSAAGIWAMTTSLPVRAESRTSIPCPVCETAVQLDVASYGTDLVYDDGEPMITSNGDQSYRLQTCPGCSYTSTRSGFAAFRDSQAAARVRTALKSLPASTAEDPVPRRMEEFDRAWTLAQAAPAGAEVESEILWTAALAARWAAEDSLRRAIALSPHEDAWRALQQAHYRERTAIQLDLGSASWWLDVEAIAAESWMSNPERERPVSGLALLHLAVVRHQYGDLASVEEILAPLESDEDTAVRAASTRLRDLARREGVWLREALAKNYVPAIELAKQPGYPWLLQGDAHWRLGDRQRAKEMCLTALERGLNSQAARLACLRTADLSPEESKLVERARAAAARRVIDIMTSKDPGSDRVFQTVKIWDPALLPGMRRLLESDSTALRRRGVQWACVFREPGEEVLRLLERMATSDENAWCRAMALQGLVTHGGDASVRTLLGESWSGDRRRTEEAIRGLAQWGDERALSVLSRHRNGFESQVEEALACVTARELMDRVTFERWSEAHVGESRRMWVAEYLDSQPDKVTDRVAFWLHALGDDRRWVRFVAQRELQDATGVRWATESLWKDPPDRCGPGARFVQGVWRRVVIRRRGR